MSLRSGLVPLGSLNRPLFGNGQFFTRRIILPLTVCRADLPTAIHDRFPKVGENSAGSKIAHVHSLVFGADSSYMLAWKGKDGKNYQGISAVYIKGF